MGVNHTTFQGEGGQYGSYSQITEHMWMGGCSDGAILPMEFDLVISCYRAERFHLEPYRTRRLEIFYHDGGRDELPATAELVAAADLACSYLHRDRNVLIHCQGGLNRSGLLVALTMMRMGYPCAKAIETIRAARDPMALCNHQFVAWLTDYAKKEGLDG